VIDVVPTGRAEVANVATWVLVLTAAVPSIEVPLLKVTVPLTGAPDVGTTVAVNVTGLPWVEGLSEEASVVVVFALFTTWLNAADVLPMRSALPPYTAVIDAVPTEIEEVANIAASVVALTAAVPSVVVPALKVTVPLTAVPAGGTTFAVKVTELPRVEGLGEEASVILVAALLTVSVSAAEVLPVSPALPA
jgi:hypothetical protein